MRTKLKGITVVGQFSNKTNKTYKNKSTLKGAETRQENKLYNQKLAQLLTKFNN